MKITIERDENGVFTVKIVSRGFVIGRCCSTIEQLSNAVNELTHLMMA